MGSDRDDELARTATAPATGSQPAPPADPVGPTLGRYRLERELGQGGMGVVHAAFDPDLERRVALKVLRNAGSSSEARQRLLREARAMARLQHPNVVTVHEVASANGRDYVAMEMIDGQSLAEWMRAERRPETEIVDAFIAAGRGLAAAHAEGIVHRDFKPHNILRHRNGRIAVTDFGLARDAEEALADPLAETRELPAGTAVSSTTPSSPLSGLTVTGSVLGTPAYMAPEQWNDGAVTPATDQFAFCVALWEALAGERPFKGPTVEQLRAEVEAGPAKLDFAKIPRRLRPALLRGLDPDPAKRWPSMNALLAAMSRVEHTSKTIYIVAGAAITAGIAVLVAMKLAGGSAPASADEAACRAPALAIDAIWPAGSADKLRAIGQRSAAQMIDNDVRAWTATRALACAIDPAKREPQLACLDGVAARLDAVARGVEKLAGKRDVDAGSYLIDPVVCALEPPPRLALTASPQMRATLAALLEDEGTPGRAPAAVVTHVVEQAKGDDCASVYARSLALEAGEPSERERLIAEMAEAGERCTDERVRAESSLFNAQLAFESALLGTSITSKVKIAELASERVKQPDLDAALEAMRGEIKRRADEVDRAIASVEAAAALYAKRGRYAAEIGQRLKSIDMKQSRGTPKDLANIPDELAAMRAYTAAKLGEIHDSVRDIDRAIAGWEFRSGDLAGAEKRTVAAYKPAPNTPSRRVRGKVVDARGKPVPSARVAAGKYLAGTAIAAASPVSDAMRFATTAADGTFEIPDAVEFGTIIAETATERSLPTLIADDVTLSLAPTATISGRVDLHGEAHQKVVVVAIDPDQPDVRYGWPGPVAADGSFSLGGVPRKRLRLLASIDGITSRQAGAIDITVTGPRVANVKLDVSVSKRVVDVVVRSTVNVPVANAEVIVVPGKLASTSARQLRQNIGRFTEKGARPIEGEKAPPSVRQVARAGDLFATINEAPEGVATACAIALPQDVADPKLGKKIDENLDKLRIECVPIPSDAQVVVVEVPPFPRID